MTRYPGSPNEPGIMHPILLTFAQGDPGNKEIVGDLIDVAVNLGSAVRRERDEVDRGKRVVRSLEDLPATDRQTDLVVLALLVESKRVHFIPEKLAMLSMYPCENFVGPHACTDENSGKSPDAQYGADRYCWPCLIRDALGGDLVQTKRR